MKRQVVIALAAGLLMSGSALAASPQASDAASGTPVSLKHEVAQAHQKVQDQKRETEQLREQVQTLQKQNQADQQRIEQNDRTIDQLRQQLKQLGVKDADAQGSSD